MNRERWDTLVGCLRENFVRRHHDPGVLHEADWEAMEIRIRNEATDQGEWILFDMDSDSEEQAPRQLAVKMVERALGLD